MRSGIGGRGRRWGRSVSKCEYCYRDGSPLVLWHGKRVDLVELGTHSDGEMVRWIWSSPYERFWTVVRDRS